MESYAMNDSIEEMELEYKICFYRKLMSESKESGLQLSRKFTIDDSLAEMQLEYEHLLQRSMVSGILQGLLIVNEKYDVFNIDNWKKIQNK